MFHSNEWYTSLNYTSYKIQINSKTVLQTLMHVQEDNANRCVACDMWIPYLPEKTIEFINFLYFCKSYID